MTSVRKNGPGSETPLGTRLAVARQVTDGLFRSVHPAALYDRPIPERHRLIFYLGHLEAFDWNLIAGADAKPVHAEFNQLFAFGIDPVDGGLPTDQPSDWPKESQVRDYDARVRARLDQIIPSANATLLHMAIEHRLMHAETLAYLLHQLPFQRKCRVPQRKGSHGTAEPPRAQTIPAGVVTLGQCRADNRFGWDNEFEATNVNVPQFRCDVFPVTNGQFLAFVVDGGYQREELWSNEDWLWKQRLELKNPGFWATRGNDWMLRTMFEEIPLPMDWPVYVSHAEAGAYASWAGRALPTEAQWHRVAYGTPDGSERPFPWGHAAPDMQRGNFDFARWDPEPVYGHPQGRSAFGIADLLGNGWEWTSTQFAPLSGFQVHPAYPGYSANFFDGKHYVLKGGSPQTAACMLRRSFRNWFQPHYPYMYAKFRCVEE